MCDDKVGLKIKFVRTSDIYLGLTDCILILLDNSLLQEGERESGDEYNLNN